MKAQVAADQKKAEKEAEKAQKEAALIVPATPDAPKANFGPKAA